MHHPAIHHEPSGETDPRYHLASALIGVGIGLNITRFLGLLTLPGEVHLILVLLLQLSGTIVLIFARPANLSQKIGKYGWFVLFGIGFFGVLSGGFKGGNPNRANGQWNDFPPGGNVGGGQAIEQDGNRVVSTGTQKFESLPGGSVLTLDLPAVLPTGVVDGNLRSVRLRFVYRFQGGDKLNDGAYIVLESEKSHAKSKIQVLYINPKGGTLEDTFAIGQVDIGPFRVSVADGPLGKSDMPTHVLSNVMSGIMIPPDPTSRVSAPNYPPPVQGGEGGKN